MTDCRCSAKCSRISSRSKRARRAFFRKCAGMSRRFRKYVATISHYNRRNSANPARDAGLPLHFPGGQGRRTARVVRYGRGIFRPRTGPDGLSAPQKDEIFPTRRKRFPVRTPLFALRAKISTRKSSEKRSPGRGNRLRAAGERACRASVPGGCYAADGAHNPPYTDTFCKSEFQILHFAMWMNSTHAQAFPQRVNNLSPGTEDLSTIVYSGKDFSKSLAAIAFWPLSC